MVPLVTGSTLHHAFSHLWHPTYAINRNAVRFFRSVLPSCSLCFYASDTHFYSHLRLTGSDSRPKRQQSGPTSGSQGSKCEHVRGAKNFRGGPNTSIEFGPGIQLLRGSKYYVTGIHSSAVNHRMVDTMASSIALFP